MTTDEVKNLLDTVSNIFTLVKANYSKTLSDEIRSVLKELTPTMIDVIATVIGVKVDKVNELVAQLPAVLDGLDQIFLTDTADKIVNFCQGMKNRPVLLKIIAWQMG